MLAQLDLEKHRRIEDSMMMQADEPILVHHKKHEKLNLAQKTTTHHTGNQIYGPTLSILTTFGI